MAGSGFTASASEGEGSPLSPRAMLASGHSALTLGNLASPSVMEWRAHMVGEGITGRESDKNSRTLRSTVTCAGVSDTALRGATSRTTCHPPVPREVHLHGRQDTRATSDCPMTHSRINASMQGWYLERRGEVVGGPQLEDRRHSPTTSTQSRRGEFLESDWPGRQGMRWQGSFGNQAADRQAKRPNRGVRGHQMG